MQNLKAKGLKGVKLMKKRIAEIQARKAEIRSALGEATTEQMEAFSAELDALEAEERQLEQRSGLLSRLEKIETPADDSTESRSARFARTNTGSISTGTTRALLTSTTGMIATPTDVGREVVEGFNNPSALCDLVNVVDANGWGAYKVPYEDADGTVADHTEGAAVSDSAPTTKYVEITPKNALILSKLSNQVLNYTPVNYEGYVQRNAVKRLRKYANSKITAELAASTLTKKQVAPLDEKFLTTVALAYGGDEEIDGEAILVIAKADLQTLGQLTNDDKKPVYEITPNPASPSTGIIKNGGLSAKYVLAKIAAGTQYYGSLRDALQLALFTPYSINVLTERFADEGMIGITGSVDMGCKVCKKDGILKISAT